MNENKNKSLVSMGFNAGAGLFAALVVVSMFMTYVSVNVLLTLKFTGFKLFDYDGSVGKPYIIISMILALSVLVLSILRLIRFPLFNARLFSVLYAIAGIALLVISIVLMIMVVKVKIGDNTVDFFERGIGVIMNLVFSIITAILCIGSSIATNKSTQTT